MSLTTTTLTFIGTATLIYLTIRFTRFLYLYARPTSLPRYLRGPSSWALITGASSGIGASLAHELAHSGFNVILHGRNASKLTTLASSLRTQYPARSFRTAVLNASSATNDNIANLAASTTDLNLTILVNNVAGGQTVQPLTRTSAADVDLSLNTNARFPAQLTRALLPRFASSPSPSLILNIGSAADTFVPYATVYGGSKACNSAMSSSLAVEMVCEDLAPKIEVLCISVGLVTEAAGNEMRESLFVPSARTMARCILRRVGCGRGVVVGCLAHAVQVWALKVLPAGVAVGVVAPIMKGRWEDERRKV